jgi:hypothetical protein
VHQEEDRPSRGGDKVDWISRSTSEPTTGSSAIPKAIDRLQTHRRSDIVATTEEEAFGYKVVCIDWPEQFTVSTTAGRRRRSLVQEDRSERADRGTERRELTIAKSIKVSIKE